MATNWYCFSIPVNPMLLLLGSSNKASWCYIHQFPVTLITKFSQFTKCDVHKSPVCASSSAPFTNLQWGTSPSSPSSPSVMFTNLQCVLHQVWLLQVHYSLISTVTSTSTPFTDLHCDFYKCTVHQSPLNLHLLATILCGYATRRLSDSVIMLPINNLSTDVNTLV